MPLQQTQAEYVFRRSPFLVLSAVCLVLIIIPSVHSQSFTKVTTGALVNDVGAFRSVNWVDINNDGYLDLFVSTGLEGGENDVLYVNNGPDSNFTFRKITSSPIVSDLMPSDGSSWGDFDNDGDLDAVVVAWYDSVNSFYANDGNGKFTPITNSPIFTDRGYSETCSWGDYDNDGYLDLYVSNSGGTLRNFLYHNNRDGTFTRITTGSIVLDAFKSRGVTWVDYDNDGDIDMFVVNESSQPNDLYRNELKETGTATFTRITTGSLVTDVSSSWSASWADYDNDGDQDVFIATGYPLYANDMLYKNNGNGTFTRILTGPLVTDAARSACGAWGDVDNDGDLDLFVTTAYASSPTKNFLYMNRLMETGSATFEQVTTGDIVNDLGSSYGAAWGDYDNDGDLDLFVANTTNEAAKNSLYRNDNANANHWIEFRCIGDSSNRSGIGTKVRAKAMINGNPLWQERVVEGQSGYCAQNLVLHFGLGNATVVDTLRVLWPSGIVDVFANVAVNRIATLNEGAAITAVDEKKSELPARFLLEQNYPNPFNPSTIIKYQLPTQNYVTLKVYDILGREVATLVNGLQNPGSYRVELNAAGFASGVYFYRIQAGHTVEQKKMLLMK